MSQCYNLVCPETRKAIWIGQRNASEKCLRLYSMEANLEQLAAFLQEHQGKAIYFVDDDSHLLEDIPAGNLIGLD